MAADRVNTLVPREGQGMKAGVQNVRFMVWPKGEPAKIVTTKGADGKDIKTAIARIPIFRWIADIAEIDSWRLSATWEGVRKAMWPHFKLVQQIQEPGEVEAPEPEYMAMVSTTGMADKGTKTITTHDRSVLFSDIPYRVETHEGAFGYDKSTAKVHPLNEGSVLALMDVFKTQAKNPQTTGRQGEAAFPKILWCPFSDGWNAKEKKEISEYEENMVLFKSWIGKTVLWKFEEVMAPTPAEMR